MLFFYNSLPIFPRYKLFLQTFYLRTIQIEWENFIIKDLIINDQSRLTLVLLVLFLCGRGMRVK